MIMNYILKNDEIHVSFDAKPSKDILNEMKSQGFTWDRIQKLWKAQYNTERENLARKIVSSDTATQDQAIALPPLGEDATLDEKLDRLVVSGDMEEKEEIINGLAQVVESDIDVYVQAIREYEHDVKEADEEKKIQRASIKDALDELDSKKKLAAGKKQYLEGIITDYLLSTGEEKLTGSIFNVSLKDNLEYSISPELEEDIRRRANLPSWISMELKVNKKEIKALEEIPEGAVVDNNPKMQSWTEEEGVPNTPSYKLSLEAFLRGESISEIAERRNFQWSTVKQHLMKAINEGLLDVHQYVSDTVLSDLDALRWHSDDWTISDYRNAINYAVSYDWVCISLSYLSSPNVHFTSTYL